MEKMTCRYYEAAAGQSNDKSTTRDGLVAQRSLLMDQTMSEVVLDHTFSDPISDTWDTLDVTPVSPSDRRVFADVVPDRPQRFEDFESCERAACTDYLRCQSKSWFAGKARQIHDTLPPLVTGIVAVTVATWYFKWPMAFGLFYIAGMLVCTAYQIIFCRIGRVRRDERIGKFHGT